MLCTLDTLLISVELLTCRVYNNVFLDFPQTTETVFTVVSCRSPTRRYLFDSRRPLPGTSTRSKYHNYPQLVHCKARAALCTFVKRKNARSLNGLIKQLYLKRKM